MQKQLFKFFLELQNVTLIYNKYFDLKLLFQLFTARSSVFENFEFVFCQSKVLLKQKAIYKQLIWKFLFLDSLTINFLLVLKNACLYARELKR